MTGTIPLQAFGSGKDATDTFGDGGKMPPIRRNTSPAKPSLTLGNPNRLLRLDFVLSESFVVHSFSPLTQLPIGETHHIENKLSRLMKLLPISIRREATASYSHGRQSVVPR